MLDNIPTTPLKTRTQAVVECFVLALAAFVFGAIAGAFLFSASQSTPYIGSPTSFFGRLINVIALQVLAFPLLSYSYLEITDRELDFIDVSRPSKRDIVVMVLGTIGLIFFNLLISAIVAYTDIPAAPSELTNLSNPLYYILLAGISIVVIAPAEELLFRGVIQKRLTEAFSEPGAILVASTIFSLPHYQALVVGEGRITTLITIFALGCILGVSYSRTENLTVPILMHGVFNAFVFSITYVEAVLTVM